MAFKRTIKRRRICREVVEEDPTAKTDHQQEEVDMISQLPDDILHHILSLLSLKEACITSTLSHRWRDLFPTLHRIHFDDSSFLYSAGCPPSPEFSMPSWLEAARHILDSRRAPVRICTIRSAYFSDEFGEGICDIIRFLCNNGVQELTIDNLGVPELFSAPPSLYFCRTLTRVELSRCYLPSPPKFGLPRRLNALKLEECMVGGDGLQQLVLGCRALESLTLEHCHQLRNLAVDAPNLAVLDVTTHRPLAVSLVNAPRLESVIVRFHGSDTDSRDSDEGSGVVGLLKSLVGVRDLSLEFQDRYLKRWRAEGLAVPATLGPILPKVKKLALKTPLNCTFSLSVASCLLNCCPNLEELDIVLDGDGSLEASLLNYWDVKMSSDCTRNTLRTVTFTLTGRYRCWMAGIKLVKFLLRNALVLKSLVIDGRQDHDGGLSMLEDLHKDMCSPPLDSPDAVVEFRTAGGRMFYRPAQITLGAP